jgi:hypothetical protein
LEPCVVGAEERAHDTGVTILLVRTARGGLVRVERRSDGSAIVAKLGGGSIDATAGWGVELGPVLSAGGSIHGGYGFRSGRAWEVRDERALATLLADLDHAPAPSVRYFEGARQTGGDVTLRLGGDDHSLELSALDGHVRQAIGRRVGPDGTTLYYGFEGGAGGPLAGLAGLPSAGDWLAEWHIADPPVLTLRRRTPGSGKDRVTETSARLVLTDPADLDTAKRLILLQTAGPIALALGRRLQQRIEERGTVQTATYAEERRGHHAAGSVKLIAGIGADHDTSVVRRRLVDARVVRPRTARRVDCLGV